MNFTIRAYDRMLSSRKTMAKSVLAHYQRVNESAIKKVIEQMCEKAQIPYMRNRDVKLVKTREGKIIPAPLADSQKGKPDLTVVALEGKTIWIETKAPGGKLEPDQEKWRRWLESRGHEYYAPSTIEEAHAVAARILEMGR